MVGTAKGAVAQGFYRFPAGLQLLAGAPLPGKAARIVAGGCSSVRVTASCQRRLLRKLANAVQHAARRPLPLIASSKSF